jgi:polyhydroxybutyrate depolymerase
VREAAVLCVILAPALGCSAGSASSPAPDAGPPPVATCSLSPTAKPGETTETLSIGGLSRTYIVHVPAGYTGKTLVPVVFDYHPLDVSASTWKNITTWGATADAEGFIVVWPQGYMNSWNVGRCCDPALSQDVDDVAFTRAILTKLSAGVCVDTKRVYATGCSNGGGMSYKLACDAADMIAAVAPVDFDCVTGAASNPSCGSCSPSRPISERQFRSTGDMFVPYDGGPTSVVAGLVFPGALANFSTWAGIDHCTGGPQVEASESACQTYSACGASTEVTLCTSSGPHCGSYAAFPIVQTAWDMFQRHALP